jgi:hypothetical protein
MGSSSVVVTLIHGSITYLQIGKKLKLISDRNMERKKDNTMKERNKTRKKRNDSLLPNPSPSSFTAITYVAEKACLNNPRLNEPYVFASNAHQAVTLSCWPLS